MSPSSEMYERSNFDASTSAGSSSSRSRSATMSGWRNRALSSKLNFASRAMTFPSPVKIIGLISANDESVSSNALYNPRSTPRAAPILASGTPIWRAMSSASLSFSPVPGSINTLWIFSGVCSATASISMPPSELAISATRCVPRSTTMPTYNSFLMSAPSSINSRRTFCPSGPVW